MKIRAGLQAKHLPSDAIARAIEDIDEQAYQEVLQKIIASKKRSLKSSDPQVREKLIRFCLQRGFTYEEISDNL
jgi:SOS response regulatory protein OraA/RecX